MLIDVQQNEEVRMGMLKKCVLYIVKKDTMPIDVPQSEEAMMGLLKGSILDVVKKGTMPMSVQQSVKKTKSNGLGLFCLKCGKNGHL